MTISEVAVGSGVGPHAISARLWLGDLPDKGSVYYSGISRNKRFRKSVK
jgi:hypothetical protein